MEPKVFHDNHFDSIQALRAFAAVFVLLEHVRFLNCGAFGVDIFFCISGFMIMFSTHRNTKHFIKKRAIRILPLYYSMTIGTFLLLLFFPSMFEQTTANPTYLIKSLLFIPFDIGGGIIQPLMRIGWTVNCEIFFYLLFFMAFHISHKYRGIICSALLGCVVLLNCLLPMDYAPLQFYGNPVMLEFILGILGYYIAWGLYQLYQKANRNPFWTIIAPICLIMIVLLFTILVLTKPTINILGLRRILLWGLPALMLIISAFILGLKIAIPTWIVQLGNMSFSIYLIHYYPVMLLDRAVFDFSTATTFSIFGVIISILICICCSYVSWYLFEKKLPKWLSKFYC